MAEIGNTSVFSQTDGSNNTGTVPSWAEGMAPSQVNDSARALQGAVTREWNWRNVTLTSGGSADTQTLTYSVAPAAYYVGQRFAFIAGFTNTGSATLNVNTLGAITFKKMVAGVATNLSAGDITAGNVYEVAYGTGPIFIVMLTAPAAASATVAGIVELATDAETQTGTDTARAITPANLTAKEASATEFRANTADRILTTDIVYTSAALVSLTWTSGGNTAVDMATFINATVTASAGNSTLGQPSNTKVGQTGVIRIIQDSTPRTLAFHADWKFAGGVDPTISTGSGAVDLLYYHVIATNFVYANLVKALA